MYERNINYFKDSLGMSPGKARRDLVKIITFNLVKELELDNCYRCGKKIDNIDDLSYEHKVDWFHSDNPRKYFSDINNITFSHLMCNTEHGHKNREISEFNTNKSMDKRRSKRLEQPFSTAYYNMVNDVLFHLVQLSNKDKCFVCNEKIKNRGEFSIEHKIPWRGKKNAKEIYFNYNNISFSHFRCNSSKARKSPVSLEKQRERTMKTRSGFKGVRPNNNKYNVYISYKGNCKFYGSFDDPIEAAKKADEVLIEVYGEDAVTNKKMGLI